MPRILHISADYPDAIAAAKTRAIAGLVEGSHDAFDHRVISLNRRGGIHGLLHPGAVEPQGDDGIVASWCYRAPSRGLLLQSAMERVGDEILQRIAEGWPAPDLVHGHKLSIEGIAARHVARRLGVPYMLTLQGNTDQKIVNVRRDLRALYREVWHNAAEVIAFAPWIAQWCTQTLGSRSRPAVALPCIPACDMTIAPSPTREPLVGTAFHLAHWRNKNVAGLARACAIAGQGIRLEIAGGGNGESERAVDAALEQSGSRSAARRIGPLAPPGLQHWMNGCAVFAMPSLRESFGMVFIEALLAGCPIIYPKGAAVDGYFDGAPFAIGVDARDPHAIASAIRAMLRDNAERKASLAQWQTGDQAARFLREAILARYQALLTAVCRSEPVHIGTPDGIPQMK